MHNNYYISNMKKIFLVILAFALVLPLQAQHKHRSDPSAHHITPSADRSAVSPYQGCKNYGKSIAVFGGSLSVNKESDTAKQIWADLLGSEVVTYGVGGAGFSIDQGYSLQYQVDTAGVHDVYVSMAGAR